MFVRILYTIILCLAAPFLLLGLYKSKPNKPKFGSRWKEHFGITPQLSSAKSKPLWIHAVSVGESIAAIPLIKALKEQNPNQTIVVTTTTSTGAQEIQKLGDLVEHRYMPIDFSFAVKGFIRAIQPEKMLIIETELWPNTLHAVHTANIPIIVVNARLSEKSCRNYAKVQALFNQIHPNLNKVLCQSQADADRFKRLGIPQDKLDITGSIKLDIKVSPAVIEESKALRNDLGSKRPVWIAASTHKGEDEKILSAHKTILTSLPDALLILVPRHPERFKEVFTLCESLGFQSVTRTSQETTTNDTQVYVGDTMGEMLKLIGAADVCFMGGSLVGDKVGGHNVLEPAILSVPVITGPSYFNFKEIVHDLESEQAIIITTESTLISSTLLLLTDSQIRKTQTSRALHYLNKNQGSLSKVLSYL